jgi:hypothetical protein
MFNMHASIAAAHFFCGRYEEAAYWAEISLGAQPQSINAAALAAASAAMIGNEPAARRAIARVLELTSTLRLSTLKEHWPLRRPEDFSRWAEALQKAGLPD